MLNPVKFYRLSNLLSRSKISYLPDIITLLIRPVFTSYTPYTEKIRKRLVLAYVGIGIVIDDIPSFSLTVGVPAKVIKTGIKRSDYV